MHFAGGGIEFLRDEKYAVLESAKNFANVVRFSNIHENIPGAKA